jgi:hypothetical protein
MTRDEAITEFRTLLAQYTNSNWLGKAPAAVFERMIELVQILAEAEHRKTGQR